MLFLHPQKSERKNLANFKPRRKSKNFSLSFPPCQNQFPHLIAERKIRILSNDVTTGARGACLQFMFTFLYGQFQLRQSHDTFSY